MKISTKKHKKKEEDEKKICEKQNWIMTIFTLTNISFPFTALQSQFTVVLSLSLIVFCVHYNVFIIIIIYTINILIR